MKTMSIEPVSMIIPAIFPKYDEEDRFKRAPEALFCAWSELVEEAITSPRRVLRIERNDGTPVLTIEKL